MKCPYCEKEQQSNGLFGHRFNSKIIRECNHCKKNFGFTIKNVPEYIINKTDCLNEGEHIFSVVSRHSDNIFARCKDCGFERVHYEPEETVVEESTE